LQNANSKIFIFDAAAKNADASVLVVAPKLLRKKAEQIRTIRDLFTRIHIEQGGDAIMPKIKVIKKGEAKPVSEPAPAKQVSKKAAAREMVSTVSNWVSDFKQRKQKETNLALEGFFPVSPATSRP
jgi:hypothetical protein